MKKEEAPQSGPAKMLASEMISLRRDLRTAIRAYSASLETAMAECADKIASYGAAEKISHDRLRDIRDLTIMLQKRKLKPEKGRCKDLRKIDMLIGDLHAVTHPGSRSR